MTARSYILALDGGQSSTICVLGTADGTLLGAGRGSPVARPFQPGGTERIRRALASAIGAALATVQPPPRRLDAAYLSLTGGVQAATEMLPTIVPVDRLLAESDTIAALASGACGGPGIGLIAGTGVCAVAETAGGVRILRGGWGCVLGDEGGGYWIGLQALQAAARADDGRGPTTALCDQVVRQCGAVDMRGVYARIYAEEIGQPEIAALAPLVLAGADADAGDPVAAAIVDAAADELASLLQATCAAAAFTQQHERLIVATGGVLRPGNALWRRLAPRVADQAPQFQFLAPRFPPVVGAFLLGLRLAGVALDAEVLARVERSQAAIPGLADKSVPLTTSTNHI